MEESERVTLPEGGMLKGSTQDHSGGHERERYDKGINHHNGGAGSIEWCYFRGKGERERIMSKSPKRPLIPPKERR